MRIFLSYSTPDAQRAEALKRAIEAKERGAEAFFAPATLKAGRFWMPQIGTAIAEADAFLLLVGEQIGPYQTIEYYQAFERHMREPGFPLVPVLMAEKAPGLPFLSQIHWIDATAPHAEPDLSRIMEALKGSRIAPGSTLWSSINPYRGLESLREEDAEFFFGREAEVAEVLTGLMAEDNSAVTLVGNSGVGKSSLIEAGVFAALKRRAWPLAGPWPEALKESRQWAFLTLRPGDDPIRALIAAFSELWFTDATDPARIERRNKWEALLRAGECGLSDLIEVTRERFTRELQLTPPARVILNINQAEELYTLATEAQQERFSQLIADGLADRRLGVLASLRSDYYGALQADLPFMKVSRKVDILPLDAEGLKTVITGPAALLGARFETDELADFIVKGAGGDKGVLPLLVDYMTDLWKRMQTRADGVLRLSDRADLIDAGRALSVRANTFLDQHRHDVDAIRQLFTLRLALVPEEGEPVRRQVARERLSPEEARLVDNLASEQWRLVLSGHRSGDPNAPLIVEIAHEVLLERWEMLKGWIAAERQFLVLKGRVEKARARWEATGRDRQALLQGLDLIQAEQYLATRVGDFENDDAEFIRASTAARDSERDAQNRLRHRMQWGTAAAAALLAGVAGAAVWQWSDASIQRDQAREERNRAETAIAAIDKAVNSLVFNIARSSSENPNIPKELITTIINSAKSIHAEIANNASASKDYKIFVIKNRLAFNIELVDLYLEIGNYAEALTVSEESLKIIDLINTPFIEIDESNWIYALAYKKYGDVLRRLSRFDEAIAMIERSTVLLRKIHITPKWFSQIPTNNMAIANIYTRKGLNEKAIELLRNSIKECYQHSEITNTVDVQNAIAYTYRQLGDIYYAANDHSAALDNYIQTRFIREELYRKIPDDISNTQELAASYYKMLASGITAKLNFDLSNKEVLERVLFLHKFLETKNMAGDNAQKLKLTALEYISRIAFDEREYAKAAGYREEFATNTEEAELQRSGKPGTETASALGTYADYALFARQFEAGMAAADRALALAPDQLWIAINRAHALMFLGRAEAARAAYLLHRGEAVGANRQAQWDEVILADFGEFESRGLLHPQMAEIRALLTSAALTPETVPNSRTGTLPTQDDR